MSRFLWLIADALGHIADAVEWAREQVNALGHWWFVNRDQRGWGGTGWLSEEANVTLHLVACFDREGFSKYERELERVPPRRPGQHH